MSISYPRYIPDLLARVRPNGVKFASTPAVYTPPSYGRKGPQLSTQLTVSPPASAAQSKELQVVVGSLLYYARAVDATLLPAVCAFSCCQAHPTLDTMATLERLLGYAAKYPTARLDFRPSDMLLRVESDASYLSRPNSGSVAGGFHYLGTSDPDFRNASSSVLVPLSPLLSLLFQKRNTPPFSVMPKSLRTSAPFLPVLATPNPPPQSYAIMNVPSV